MRPAWDLPPLLDPEALPHVLSRPQALARGFSRRAIEHRLARGTWALVLPGVIATVPLLSERDRQDAALLLAGPTAALSGASALRASGFGRIPQPERILVLAAPGTSSRRHGWVHVRRTVRPFEVVRWTGPRRVEIARAAADYALTLQRLDDVRALVARLIATDRCSVGDLEAELAAGPRNGSALLRTALTETGASASAPEAVAAKILRSAGLTGFEQNASIRLPSGRFYVADFLWREFRAILEIDSIEFHLGPAEWRATMDRHLALTSLGYSVVHRPPSALKDANLFRREIGSWLRNRRDERRSS